MNFLKGEPLITKNHERVTAESVLENAALVLYYFTIPGGTKEFDKKLKVITTAAEEKSIKLAVIIVLLDSDTDVTMKIMKNEYDGYFAIPVESELNTKLKLSYGVTHVPYLVVVSADGDLVTREGVTHIENLKTNVLITWM